MWHPRTGKAATSGPREDFVAYWLPLPGGALAHRLPRAWREEPDIPIVHFGSGQHKNNFYPMNIPNALFIGIDRSGKALTSRCSTAPETHGARESEHGSRRASLLDGDCATARRGPVIRCFKRSSLRSGVISIRIPRNAGSKH